MIFKQIQYDSRSAENAAENPDVARDGDKERAEKGIQDSNIKLLESKTKRKEKWFMVYNFIFYCKNGLDLAFINAHLFRNS